MVILKSTKLYFDTDPIVDIFCPGKKTVNKVKIKKAEELWNRWSGEPIRISPYLISEFIARARNKGYSINDILDIVNKRILPKCKIITAKLPSDSAILDNMPFLDKYGLLTVDFKGEATIDNIPIGQHSASFVLSKDLLHGTWSVFDKWTEGIQPGLSFINTPEITIGATYFEIEFFKKVSELSLEFKMRLKDSIHLLYAIQEKVDIIVANCDDFRNAAPEIKRKFGIEVYSPNEVLNQLPPP